MTIVVLGHGAHLPRHAQPHASTPHQIMTFSDRFLGRRLSRDRGSFDNGDDTIRAGRRGRILQLAATTRCYFNPFEHPPFEPILVPPLIGS